MFENIKTVVLFTLWIISWMLAVVGTGFLTKILANLFMLGWDLI